MAELKIIARLLEPSSELFIAEHWFAKTALPALLGVADTALYAAKRRGRNCVMSAGEVADYFQRSG